MEESLENALIEISEWLARPLVVENVLVLLGQDLEVKLTHVLVSGKVFCVCVRRDSINITYSAGFLERGGLEAGRGSKDSEVFEEFRIDSEPSDYFRLPIPLGKPIHLINFTE